MKEGVLHVPGRAEISDAFQRNSIRTPPVDVDQCRRSGNACIGR
jgi:hypothetical protein